MRRWLPITTALSSPVERDQEISETRPSRAYAAPRRHDVVAERPADDGVGEHRAQLLDHRSRLATGGVDPGDAVHRPGTPHRDRIVIFV